MPISDWFVLVLVAACVSLVALASIRSRRMSPRADIAGRDAVALCMRADGTASCELSARESLRQRNPESSIGDR